MKNQIGTLFFSFSILFLFTISNSIAQADKILTANKLEKDFARLLEIVDAHPDPFTHITEADFNHKFDSVKSNLNKPLTVLEFYKKAAYIIALIKDGHSSARLPSEWLKKQRKTHGAFPYEMYLSNDDKLYVLKSFENDGIPTGAKILKINGISVKNFIEKIDPYISYELKKFRNTIIDNQFEQFLYLAFGFSENTEIEYSFTDTLVVKTKNMPLKEWKDFVKEDREEREKKIALGEPYSYKKLTDGVGMINIYAFRTRNMKAYSHFLNKTFKKIKNDEIHSLIIDVRGNYGGWPKIGSKIFHYITDNHFKTQARSSAKISEPYRENLFKRMPGLAHYQNRIPERRHHIDLAAIARDKIGTYVDEEEFFNEKPITENYEFTGDCYLLTNRDSYSAASSFAATFQCYQMGVIIGEETGGTKIFRANAIYEVLGKSDIRISMSTTKNYNTCFSEEFEGIKPTIEYSPKIFELKSGMDTHLLFAQRIIKQVQAKLKEK